MRYRIEKLEQEFFVTIWPEPYNFETTAEKEKENQRFIFSEEGREEMVQWLNQRYLERQAVWEDALHGRK